MPTTWKQEAKKLGVDSDTAIALRLGVSKERVRQVRTKLSIPPAPRRLGRRKRDVGTNDVQKCLYAVPLSAADRQLLTDARVVQGFTQTELAVQTGSSLSFIHSIEAGKKSPSPKFLNRLCKALGLEWQCEFRVRIVAKASKRSKRPHR